jgi:ethanolamine ammonia-lyase large subunit
MLKFEDCKKVLNKNNEHYTDDQIKEIMALLDYWARINAKVILKKLKEIENEEGCDNGSCEHR